MLILILNKSPSTFQYFSNIKTFVSIDIKILAFEIYKLYLISLILKIILIFNYMLLFNYIYNLKINKLYNNDNYEILFLTLIT